MSTRSIQDALDMLESLLFSDDDAERAMLDGARVELKAIREAAREVVSYKALEDWQTSMPSELATSIRLIQRIAKEG